MCGIIGYVGERDASFILVQGLKRLEYRGYDSAGVATFHDGAITIRRCLGKLENLEKLLREAPLAGTVGIGHTRWATHGRPSEQNAHPHRAGKIVVIHNGIIENYLDLRAALHSRGRTFSSETDTEVISHLIDEHVQKGEDLLRATRAVVQQLEGSFSIVVMHEDSPDRLVAAKSATPIVIGLGENENFVASDIPAILDHTRRILFLEDGEIAEVTRDRVAVSTFAGETVTREPRTVAWDPVTAQKGGYRHFLLKEIHEQPQAIIDTMRGRILQEQADVSLAELAGADWLLNARRISFVACGTASHACLVGKYFIEHIARIPAEVDYGSEFRSRDPVMEDGTVLVVISQSGETADTLAAVETAHERGAKVLAICNVVDSSIARKADATIYTHAGPEISVASTKAFTTQLTVLYLLGIYIARRRGVCSEPAARSLIHDLVNLPAHIEECLKRERAIEKVAKKYGNARDFHQRGGSGRRPAAEGRRLPEEPLEHEGGRVARRAHHRRHRLAVARAGRHRLGGPAGADQQPVPAAGAAHDPAAAPRVLHRRLPWHGRRPAAQSREERHRRVALR